MAANGDFGGPAFVVVDGSRSGELLPIDRPISSIGRDEGAALRLPDDGVSRNHAVVVRSVDGVSLEDAGSTNGTWVNGTRITAARTLRPGDVIRVGSTTLRYRHGEDPVGDREAGQPPARARRKVSLMRIVLIAGLANLVVLAAGVAIQFATDWTGIGPWLAAPLTGMVAALVEAGREALTRDKEAPAAVAPSSQEAAYARATGPVQPPPRRVPIAVSIALIVVLVGLGGVALTYGVATVSGYITGNQVGTDRLQNGPVTVDAKGIVTTIEAVEQTRDFTRVDITVKNNLANTVTLPLFHNVTLSDSTATLSADSFRSSWSETIAPGQQSRGSIIFGGHLSSGQTTAALAFATVFKQGFDGPDSIVVPKLTIAPAE